MYIERQNLPKITRISAAHSNDVAKVLETMKECETITLTEEDLRLGHDIWVSIAEHRTMRVAEQVAYLIRLGILLGKKEAASDATNIESGK